MRKGGVELGDNTRQEFVVKDRHSTTASKNVGDTRPRHETGSSGEGVEEKMHKNLGDKEESK